MKKVYYLSLLVLAASLISSSQAAIFSISGTISSSNPVGVPAQGMVSGSYDDATNALDITVSFHTATGIKLPAEPNSAIADATNITVGDPTLGGATTVAGGSFSLVTFSSDAIAGSGSFVFPITTQVPHVVQGTYTLSSSEEAELQGGNLFVFIDGSDADAFASISSTPIPEPSSVILSIVGLGVLARRRRS